MIPKFRAFSKKHKKLFNISLQEIIVGDDCIFYQPNMPFVDSVEIVLMQSTGLHDKNGKEIFEGDIVKAWSEGYCGTFQVKWRNEGAPMYILYPAWQNEQFWNLHGNSIRVDDGIEIIGNIHENPELLNT